jgi:hypothetical protein
MTGLAQAIHLGIETPDEVLQPLHILIEVGSFDVVMLGTFDLGGGS